MKNANEMTWTRVGAFVTSFIAIGGAACGGATGETLDERVGQTEAAIHTYEARLLPSAYRLLFLDATESCGENGSLSHILQTEPVWKYLTDRGYGWTKSAGALLVDLARRVDADTHQSIDAEEHTAAYWALLVAHDANPGAPRHATKVIHASKLGRCAALLFGGSKPLGELFVVAAESSVNARAWELNTGHKKKADPFSPYSLDDALVCFADPTNTPSARQVAIWDGTTTWLVADPPRSGLAQ